MKNQGVSSPQTAKIIGVNKTTVYRKIARNCVKRNGNHFIKLADKKYKQRQQNKSRHKGFTLTMQELIDSLLKKDYSPEQVVGILKKKSTKKPFPLKESTNIFGQTKRQEENCTRPSEDKGRNMKI
jgi:IS30 family transposase